MAKFPNIILIVIDTARARNFSSYGYTRNTTPQIDQIAHEGVRFTNAFSASPWTFPSHASIFTGLYPSQHGAHEKHKFLDSDNFTIAQFFQQQGYRTVALNANTWISNTFGLERGFDDFLKMWQMFSTQTDLSGISLDAEFTQVHDRRKQFWNRISTGNILKNAANAFYVKYLFKRNDYAGQQITTKAIRWLRQRNSEQPFFMFINYLEPHLQYKPPQAFQYRYSTDHATTKRFLQMDQVSYAWRQVVSKSPIPTKEQEALTALYDAELAYTDTLIKQLYGFLQAEQLLEETILVITADHGENLGEHGLLDHQYCLYDTLLHIPLIIRFPATIERGQVQTKLAQSVDLFPTLTQLAGLDSRTLPIAFSGLDLFSTQHRQQVIAEYLGAQPTLPILNRFVPEAPLAELRQFERSLRSIRKGEWKFIAASDNKNELYNIQTDPDETKNLIHEQSQIAQEMKSALNTWLTGISVKNLGSVTEEPEIDAVIRRQLEALGYM